jgi:hypothetical protein
LSTEEETQAEKPSTKRRRFSTESLNDLLFWIIQLSLVALALGIMWVKVDTLARALKTILKSEESQNQTLMLQTIQAREAERTRSIQFDAATRILDTVVGRVGIIQADIKATLTKTMETNQLVLAQSEATRAAALASQQSATQAAGAAQNAAGAAGSAAGAAARAAATSSHTSNVVATKVVTTSAKARLEAQQRALALKQAQLSRTIKQVKKHGPTLLQQIFH